VLRTTALFGVGGIELKTAALSFFPFFAIGQMLPGGARYHIAWTIVRACMQRGFK